MCLNWAHIFSYSGLANLLLQQSKRVAVRIWLIDNSGSMNQNDGHRPILVTGKNKVSTVNCTRWEEVRSTVIWHTNLSAIIQAPIVFRVCTNFTMQHLQHFIFLFEKLTTFRSILSFTLDVCFEIVGQ